ncbi:MAG: DUF2283 domain-containing protein [Candidatus Latescibacterota bacterium]
MQDRYLEITFRRGRPLAAYLYLGRQRGAAVATSRRPADNGLVLDYGPEGQLVGIEITAPNQTSLADLNSVLGEHRLPPLARDEVAPLQAA